METLKITPHESVEIRRSTPEALELLLADYPSKIVGWHGPAERPANVWALAFREGRPAIRADERQRSTKSRNKSCTSVLEAPCTTAIILTA